MTDCADIPPRRSIPGRRRRRWAAQRAPLHSPQPAGMVAARFNSAGVKPLQPRHDAAGVKTARFDSAGMKPARLESAGVKSARLHTAGVKPAGLEAPQTAVKAPAGKAPAVKTTTEAAGVGRMRGQYAREVPITKQRIVFIGCAFPEMICGLLRSSLAGLAPGRS